MGGKGKSEKGDSKGDKGWSKGYSSSYSGGKKGWQDGGKDSSKGGKSGKKGKELQDVEDTIRDLLNRGAKGSSGKGGKSMPKGGQPWTSSYGASSSKDADAYMPTGAKTVQEIEADILKQKQAGKAPRSTEDPSKIPLEHKGAHCEVKKHSDIGCAVISMESESARDAMIKLGERNAAEAAAKDTTQAPEKQRPQVTISGFKVQLRPHFDKAKNQEIKTDLFVAWGRQVEKQSPLSAEVIAEAFDAMWREEKAQMIKDLPTPIMMNGMACPAPAPAPAINSAPVPVMMQGAPQPMQSHAFFTQMTGPTLSDYMAKQMPGFNTSASPYVPQMPPQQGMPAPQPMQGGHAPQQGMQPHLMQAPQQMMQQMQPPPQHIQAPQQMMPPQQMQPQPQQSAPVQQMQPQPQQMQHQQQQPHQAMQPQQMMQVSGVPIQYQIQSIPTPMAPRLRADAPAFDFAAPPSGAMNSAPTYNDVDYYAQPQMYSFEQAQRRTMAIVDPKTGQPVNLDDASKAAQAPQAQASSQASSSPSFEAQKRKPLTIKDPNNGHVLATLGLNFKPAEPKKPLDIVDPTSGDSIKI